MPKDPLILSVEPETWGPDTSAQLLQRRAASAAKPRRRPLRREAASVIQHQAASSTLSWILISKCSQYQDGIQFTQMMDGAPTGLSLRALFPPPSASSRYAQMIYIWTISCYWSSFMFELQCWIYFLSFCRPSVCFLILFPSNFSFHSVCYLLTFLAFWIDRHKCKSGKRTLHSSGQIIRLKLCWINFFCWFIFKIKLYFILLYLTFILTGILYLYSDSFSSIIKRAEKPLLRKF